MSYPEGELGSTTLLAVTAWLGGCAAVVSTVMDCSLGLDTGGGGAGLRTRRLGGLSGAVCGRWT